MYSPIRRIMCNASEQRSAFAKSPPEEFGLDNAELEWQRVAKHDAEREAIRVSDLVSAGHDLATQNYRTK